MSFPVEFLPEAADDYRKLDGSVRKDVNKKIDELAENPFLGERLGHKFSIDLTGFLKIYVHGKKYRIVYRLIEPERIEIIEIWGIGKREKEKIYKLIGERVKKRTK